MSPQNGILLGVKVFYTHSHLSSQGDVAGDVKEMVQEAGLLYLSLARLGEVAALWTIVKPSSKSSEKEGKALEGVI